MSAAIRTAFAITIATAAVSAVVLVSVPACEGLPNGICRGETVNGLSTERDPDAGRDCTTCLQQKCCDFVGFCSDRNTTGASCPDQFRDAHACVVEGGPVRESRCTSRIIDDGGKELYGCMRENCPSECAVPSCKLDNSVILFGTSTCDRCMGSACCGPINACYGDRRCKLIIECVLKTCGRLGEGMNDLRQALDRGLEDGTCGAGNDDAPRPPVLADGGAPPNGLQSDFGCILKCLDEFAPDDAGTADDLNARCKAFQVYTCGARQNCGNDCILPRDAGVDATTDAPVDAPDDVKDASDN